MKELDHVMMRQYETKPKPGEEQEFRDKARTYLDEVFSLEKPEDFANLFLTSTFMNKQRGE